MSIYILYLSYRTLVLGGDLLEVRASERDGGEARDEGKSADHTAINFGLR